MTRTSGMGDHTTDYRLVLGLARFIVRFLKGNPLKQGTTMETVSTCGMGYYTIVLSGFLCRAQMQEPTVWAAGLLLADFLLEVGPTRHLKTRGERGRFLSRILERTV